MVNVSKEESNAFSEVLEILNNMTRNDYKKVPKEIIILFNKYSNKESKFKYNPNKKIEKQNISKTAKQILATLYMNYWASPSQKEKIIEKQKMYRIKKEMESREKYNPDNLFKKKEIIKAHEKNTELVEYKEKNYFEKILHRIMSFLKRNTKNRI